MSDTLTAYQKRVQKEERMRQLFTRTFNTGGLNQLLERYGLKMFSDGTVRDRGAVNKIFKDYLEQIVLPAIEKELGITGIKIHPRPSTLTQNLFRWYKADIEVTITNPTDNNN